MVRGTARCHSKQQSAPVSPTVQTPKDDDVHRRPRTHGAASRYPRYETFPGRTDHSAKTFCFQSFDDQGRDLSLARTFHGPLDECAPALARLNERGAGIFTTVNVIAAEQRRTAENVVRVRAVFVDVDDPTSLPKVESAIARHGLTPSIVVESSPGKRHFYWRTDDCLLEEFKGAQQALARLFGTDPSVCDLPRVMRLLGFIHWKGAPFRSRLVSAQ